MVKRSPVFGMFLALVLSVSLALANLPVQANETQETNETIPQVENSENTSEDTQGDNTSDTTDNTSGETQAVIPDNTSGNASGTTQADNTENATVNALNESPEGTSENTSNDTQASPAASPLLGAPILGAPSDTWAEGKIEVQYRIVLPDRARNYQYNTFFAYSFMPHLAGYGGSATLYDSEGQEVESYVGESDHTFQNLPAGQYRLALDTLDRSGHILHLFKAAHNGWPLSTVIVWDEDSPLLDITITEGNTAIVHRWIALELNVYTFKTITDVGTFLPKEEGSATPGRPSDDGKEYIYYGQYGGGSWAIPNEGGDDYIPYIQTHDGIYYGDYAGLYRGMTALQVPTLSADETAKGYTFKGWQLTTDDSGRIFNEAEALSHVIRSNTVFKAVWDRPSHSVTFNSNGGTPVDPQTVAHGDPATQPQDPTQDGYVFKGWQLNGTDYDFATPVTEDIELTAVWEPAEPEENTTEPEDNTTEPEENTTEPEDNTTEPEDNETKDNTTEPRDNTTKPEDKPHDTGNNDQTPTPAVTTPAPPEAPKAAAAEPPAPPVSPVVISVQESQASVATGDSSLPGLWAFLAVLSLGGVLGILYSRKQRRSTQG